MKNPFLIGEHVYLRPLEMSDAAAMVPWMNDRDVTRTLQSFRPMNEEWQPRARRTPRRAKHRPNA